MRRNERKVALLYDRIYSGSSPARLLGLNESGQWRCMVRIPCKRELGFFSSYGDLMGY